MARWRWAWLVVTYARAVMHHAVALFGGALVLCSQAIINWLTDAHWEAPGWLRPSGWLLVSAAQYLAWRDAWEARGTPSRPVVPQGVRLIYQTLTLESERPTLLAALDIEKDLGRSVLEIYCDAPVLVDYIKASWAGTGRLVEGGKVRPAALPVFPLGTQSFIVDFRFDGAIEPRAESAGSIILSIPAAAPTLNIIRVEEQSFAKSRRAGRTKGNAKHLMVWAPPPDKEPE